MEEQIIDMLVNLYPKTKDTEMDKIRKILVKTIKEANLSEKVEKAVLTGACLRLHEEIMIEALRKRPMNDRIAVQSLIEMMKECWALKTKEDIIKMLEHW